MKHLGFPLTPRQNDVCDNRLNCSKVAIVGSKTKMTATAIEVKL